MTTQAPFTEPKRLVVHTRPVVDLDDEQFFQFCRINRDLQIERTSERDIILMAPEAGSSGRATSKLTMLLGLWAEHDGTGQVFGPSTGFKLPNGAIRSPDVAWVRHERIQALTDEEWQKFLPLCPDFVLELRSPSDSIQTLQEKMEEYRSNGATLGWLLDPVAMRVHVYRGTAAVEILVNPATLAADPLLRGFVLDVPRIWAVIQRTEP